MYRSCGVDFETIRHELGWENARSRLRVMRRGKIFYCDGNHKTTRQDWAAINALHGRTLANGATVRVKGVTVTQAAA